MANRERALVDISLRSFLYLFAAIAAIAFIWYISDVLVLIFVSIVFAAALEPSVKALQKLKLPRLLAISLIYIIFIGLIFFTLSLIVPTVSDQIKTISANLPNYRQKLQGMLSHSPLLNQLFVKASARLSTSSEQIVSNAGPVVLKLFGSILGFLTFLVLTFYMLLGGKQMVLSGFEFIPQPKLRKRLINLSLAISTKLGYWLRGQAVLGFIIFTASFIGLSVLNVEYALTLAVIAGIMELVPLVGAYLGAIPAILVAFTVSPTKGFAVAVLFFFLQLTEGHIIVPQVMKRALGLPPIIILPAVLIGGKIFGFIGVLLATPIAATILVIIQDIEREPNLLEL